ncbi:MAG TPA: ABC transporter permease [Candidatus Dormibacteraeota bacterium]
MNTVAQPAAIPAAVARRTRPSFPGAVRSELLKIGRQGLTWVMVGGFTLLTAIVLIAIVAGGPARDTLAHDPRAFYFTYLSAMQQLFDTASGIFLLIASSRLVSMEYGSGTIRVVLARGTGRLGLLAAQYAALAITGLLLLAGFALVSTAFLYVLVVSWHGGFSPITSLPQVAWTDTWLTVLVALASIAVCILLGTAAAVAGRSVAFGVGAAMAFFPADNFGTIVMLLLSRLTHQDIWPKLTQYFLGPVMNQLPAALQTDHRAGAAFATVLVQGVPASRLWAVAGAYSLVFLAAAVVLTWRRDVLH